MIEVALQALYLAMLVTSILLASGMMPAAVRRVRARVWGSAR